MKRVIIFVLLLICGDIIVCTAQNIVTTTTRNAPAQASGSNIATPSAARNYAELPAMVERENFVYGYHDQLPSNPSLRNYSFCFDKERYCSRWVAYPLHAVYLGTIKRNDKWRFDPHHIENAYEPDVRTAYKRPGESSIYDRGHQLPSADRTSSQSDNQTTFYGTNVTPQYASLNRGKWKSLEDDVRNWICNDTLYVVSGAHFEEGATYIYTNDAGGNGKECPAPTHYYKVLLRTKSGTSGRWVVNCTSNELQCIGFWFENRSGATGQVVSVAEIEEKTGLTFFPNVPNAPKERCVASEWY